MNKQIDKQMDLYHQDLTNGNFYIDKVTFNGLKKLEIDKSFHYVKWSNQLVPLQFLSEYEKIITFNYPRPHGPRLVKQLTQIYDADGVKLTVILYNHFKKGFVIDSISFHNITFKKFLPN